MEGLTVLRFDAVDKALYIDSKIGDFTSLISTQTGFGTVNLKQGKASLKLLTELYLLKRYLCQVKKYRLLKHNLQIILVSKILLINIFSKTF
jgi:hypothetical protein